MITCETVLLSMVVIGSILISAPLLLGRAIGKGEDDGEKDKS